MRREDNLAIGVPRDKGKNECISYKGVVYVIFRLINDKDTIRVSKNQRKDNSTALSRG